MRTVSREDELIERAANPRTGIVSPFVTNGESSRVSIDTDYIAVGRMQAAEDHQKRNVPQGRWKQDSAGWSIVRGPLLNPMTESLGDRSIRQVSVQTIKDKLSAQMPITDDTGPSRSPNEDVLHSRESIMQFSKTGRRTNTLVDPDTLPRIRQMMPEGPITPASKPQSIPKKEVGVIQMQWQFSDETVVTKSGARLSTSPIVESPPMAQQHVRIVTPSQTALDQSSKTVQGHWATPSDTRSPSSTAAGDSNGCPALLQPACRRFFLADQYPVDITSNDLQASPTLSQCLPHLDLKHPTQVTNLATTSYRRPTQPLPLRLRTMAKKTKAVEDTCILTTPMASTPPSKKDLRPRLQQLRSLGTTQSRDPLSLSGGVQRQHVAHQNMRRMHPITRVTPQKAALTSANVADIRSAHTDVILEGDPLKASKTSNAVSMGGAQIAAWAAMLEDNCVQEKMKALHSPKREMSPRDANTVRDENWQDPNIDNSIRTFDRRSDRVKTAEADQNTIESKLREQNGPAVFDNCVGEGGVRFRRNWAGEVDRERATSLPYSEVPSSSADHISLVENTSETKQWLEATESWTQMLLVVVWTRQKLRGLSLQVLGTLRGASAAIEILRSPRRTTLEHLKASRDIIAAGFYLLLLANLCMTVGRVCLIVLRALYWISLPFLLISRLLRWCVLG